MNWLSYITPLELVKVNSPINGEIKVIESFGRRTLYVKSAEQSGGTITEMWNGSIKRIKNLDLKVKNCLVLGLGGGTVVKSLQDYYPGLKIDVVEFDPMIIEIAVKYFDLKSFRKLEIINADAFYWIKTTKKRYDLIILDLFLGKFNPGKSRELFFLKDLKKLRSPSGHILYNAHYRKDERNYQKLLEKCRNVFSNVKLLLSRPYSRILLLGN